jgi:autophagy-related protein 9
MRRFVAFISGSFASVLVLFSLIDPDAFLHFEVTPERTVLFYIGIFGSLMAIARGMVPDDHRVVDPEALMREVVEETHYMPVHWRSNLHSADVGILMTFNTSSSKGANLCVVFTGPPRI